jgi:hypothetical protein
MVITKIFLEIIFFWIKTSLGLKFCTTCLYTLHFEKQETPGGYI